MITKALEHNCFRVFVGKRNAMTTKGYLEYIVREIHTTIDCMSCRSGREKGARCPVDIGFARTEVKRRRLHE